MRVFLYVVACEALVQLWFNAKPIQVARWFIILNTRWASVDGEHVFECKYCTSFWVGVLLALAYYLEYTVIEYFVYALVFHRLSNFLHVAFSYLRDRQFDIRVARRHNGNL